MMKTHGTRHVKKAFILRIWVQRRDERVNQIKIQRNKMSLMNFNGILVFADRIPFVRISARLARTIFNSTWNPENVSEFLAFVCFVAALFSFIYFDFYGCLICCISCLFFRCLFSFLLVAAVFQLVTPFRYNHKNIVEHQKCVKW